MTSKLDDNILNLYMIGFNDELYGLNNIELLINAYNLGRQHAIIGDDLTSFDYKVKNEDVIKEIKNGKI